MTTLTQFANEMQSFANQGKGSICNNKTKKNNKKRKEKAQPSGRAKPATKTQGPSAHASFQEEMRKLAETTQKWMDLMDKKIERLGYMVPIMMNHM